MLPIRASHRLPPFTCLLMLSALFRAPVLVILPKGLLHVVVIRCEVRLFFLALGARLSCAGPLSKCGRIVA